MKIKTLGSDEVKIVKPKKLVTKKKITLVNLFERKGGLFFNTLARRLPEYEFLGVEGGYGRQEKVELPNMTYVGNNANMKSVYADTRILLMPSMYESYGRTAIEAMCSGIPVIAAPTPGLKESMGEAGIFCSLDSMEDWITAIKSLDDEKTYKAQSKICADHALEVEIKVNKELELMDKFFNDILMKKI
jgi:glycosyltransferase involved in cell wall biosynthesis